MVTKIPKICKLILVAFFLFLTGYLFSFFYFLEKDSLWEIRIGFPFPHFGYNFMGYNCQDFLWGYGSGTGKTGNLAFANPLICLTICYIFNIVLKKQSIALQQKIKTLFFILILPILIFCSISFISFFPLEKQNNVNDILIGFPFTFYEYRYIGENCSAIEKNWNVLFLVMDFIIIYVIYFVLFMVIFPNLCKLNKLFFILIFIVFSNGYLQSQSLIYKTYSMEKQNHEILLMKDSIILRIYPSYHGLGQEADYIFYYEKQNNILSISSLKQDKFKPETTIFLNVIGRNLAGKMGKFSLNHEKVDFEYQGRHLKNDVLEDYLCEDNSFQIELKVIEPKNQ
ncbi:hypothetical protein [Capnocytophaga catalasegens]|uniref:Uncharacterized protein n=1 Tax=Capnocytophaga catalasegens TaxID=1004260 RepID=A0AAV5AWG8_9FLAO|nr:hypothetical protein [Capnocytophaga catalasegens]GIZ15258.1 hypothetical protein RCZ03_12580 [Capnocytophaga catalasegens]GJM49772.1 hypothetical protein RCZ15_07470 [Capnocytophaga catalasegens]GJM52837.1 hypothetical protein RCZ16_11540 [Capnocytophaga catalasegens]